MRISASPAGRGRTGKWPRRSKTCAATAPGPGSANWPATGSAPPNPIDLAKALDYSRQAADAALAALAPADALRYYAQALDLYAQIRRPRSDPRYRPGHRARHRPTPDRRPRLRDTLLDAARRAADLGDTKRLVAAALANNRGMFTAVGTIDADKVEILEMALDRLAARRPRPGARARHPVLRSSPTGVRSSVARRWPTRPSPSPSPPATTPPSCGSSTTSRSRSSCRPCSNSRWPGRPTPCVRAERVGDPVLLFWAAWSRRQAAARAGDIDEMDRCFEIIGSLAEQLDQPILNWVHSFTCALRAQIAGDTEQAEQLATRGTPDRHRRRPTRRRHRSSARSSAAVSFAARHLWRAGPAPRADGRRHSRARRSDRCGAGSGPCRSRPNRRRRVACWRSSPPPTSIFRSTRVAHRNDQYADVAIACRDPKYAGPLFDRLAPWADQMSTGRHYG